MTHPTDFLNPALDKVPGAIAAAQNVSQGHPEGVR